MVSAAVNFVSKFPANANFADRMRLFFIFMAGISFLNAQIDTALGVPLLGVHLSGQVPYGDLANRFGQSLSGGGSFMYKTSSNWIFGLESSYIFGKTVKEDVLAQLKTEGGFVIDNEGFPADLRVTESAVNVHLVGGRIFRVFGSNYNSGILLAIGAGGIQHRIRLYDAQQRIAAIRGDLRKGYDRLTAGFSLTQFIGYLYLSKYRYVNFYAGIEVYQAFTKSVRKFNYDTGLPDKTQRFDGLAGLRFGWILPLYKKAPDEFYYY